MSRKRTSLPPGWTWATSIRNIAPGDPLGVLWPPTASIPFPHLREAASWEIAGSRIRVRFENGGEMTVSAQSVAFKRSASEVPGE